MGHLEERSPCGGQLFAQKVGQPNAFMMLVNNSQEYRPYLLNNTGNGEYHPSFIFTEKDQLMFSYSILSLHYSCRPNLLTTDHSENIAETYKPQNERTMPGGLKVISTTAFGRSLGR